jgi:hypothetical protein
MQGIHSLIKDPVSSPTRDENQLRRTSSSTPTDDHRQTSTEPTKISKYGQLAAKRSGAIDRQAFAFTRVKRPPGRDERAVSA